MRKLLFLLLAVGSTTFLSAQMSPVNWEFTAEKVADDTYDVTFAAEIQPGWHVYSQFTAEGGPQPTEIQLENGEKIHTSKETGPRLEREDPLFGVEVIEFSKTYTIEQRVKLPAGATTLDGFLNFMTCDGERCMPPADVNFSIPLR